MKTTSIMKPLIGLAAVVSVALLIPSANAGKPASTTISGKMIDLTCAAKGKAMMDTWDNVNEDHTMGPGKIMKGCATLCLKGGQPAALYKSGKILATFACNPRATLVNYAAAEVEVQGFWAGDGRKSTFIPQKIRKKGEGAWASVNCATMHN